MDRSVEIRQAEGRDPMLHGIILQEGRAATGGRAELFAPQSVQWPADGVAVLTAHKRDPETRGHVVRHKDGRLEITAAATPAIVAAVDAGKKFMSVEFAAIADAVTKGGVREITRALVDAVALVANPEYGHTKAEYRGDTLAALIRRLRDRAGITNRQLAEAGGIDESTMGHILSLGDPRFQINCPPLNRLRGFARILGVPASALIEAAETDGCNYASTEERARIWV